MMKALKVKRSTMAAAMTLSVKIWSHLSKPRFVVMMMDLMPARSDMRLKRASAPSLSKDLYPHSSSIVRSYYSKRFWSLESFR